MLIGPICSRVHVALICKVMAQFRKRTSRWRRQEKDRSSAHPRNRILGMAFAQMFAHLRFVFPHSVRN